MINTSIRSRALLSSMVFLNKILRTTSKGMFVQQSGINKIKEYIKRNERVVLVPYFRTYTDFFALLYALWSHEIPIPFTFGNLEDTPRSRIFDSLSNRIGYIRARRSRE